MTTKALSDLLLKSGQLVRGFMDQEDKERDYYRTRPVQWIYDNLGFECQGVQGDVLNALAKDLDPSELADEGSVHMMTGHSCGKSRTAAAASLWWLDTRVDSKVMTTAPGERQLKHILWAEIGALFANWKKRWQWTLTRGMNLYNKKLSNSWFALGIFSQEASKIEGFHTEKIGNLLIVVDEAKAVPDEFFVATATMLGKRLLTSVPPLNPKGFFVDACTKNRRLWKCFHMSSLDSSFVTPQWIAARKIDWKEGSPVYTAKVLGQIPKYSSYNLVINPGQVEDAQKRWEEKHSWTNAVGVGVDVARFGDDTTVITDVVNNRLIRIIEKAKTSIPTTVGLVVENLYHLSETFNKKNIEIKPKEIPTAIDDTGVGGGVVDELIDKGYNIIPVNFAERADNPEKYINKRTELCWELEAAMCWLQLPADDAMHGAGIRLAAELTSVQFSYTSTGKKLEPKESVKKRSGQSPNIFDSLALAVSALGKDQGGEAGLEIWD